MNTNTSNQIPARNYNAVKCVLLLDVEFTVDGKHFFFAAGSSIVVDLNESIAFAQGIHFSIEPDEYAIPN